MHDNTNPTRPKVTVPLNKFVSLVMYFLQCCYVSPITSRKSSGKGEVHIWQSIASWLRLFVCRNKLPRRWHQSQWIYSVRRRWETLTTRAIMYRLREASFKFMSPLGHFFSGRFQQILQITVLTVHKCHKASWQALTQAIALYFHCKAQTILAKNNNNADKIVTKFRGGSPSGTIPAMCQFTSGYPP